MTKPQNSSGKNQNSNLTDYDLWSQNYDSFENPMIAMVDWALDQEPLPITGLDVLELGCGTGRNLDRLMKSQIKSYTGLDGSSGMLARAKFRSDFSNINSNVKWIHADLDQILPLPDANYDFVLVTLVLEHLSSLDLLFNEVHRILKPNGQFRILEIHSQLVTRGTQAHFWHDGKEVRLQSYPHERVEYQKVSKAAGFEIRKILEWQPPDQLIAKMPKLSKHSNQPMIMDVCIQKRLS